jgi:RHS repeat-associated protein
LHLASSRHRLTDIELTERLNAGLPVVLDDGNQYVYGAGLSSMKQGGNWYYYLADGLGSTMAIVDASGDVEKGYTYDVYGEPTVTRSLGNEFDFAGQQTDPSTGLQYLRARYYDPQSGTFMSREPLAVAPGWLGNPSGYAGANPARFVDPSGLRFCDVDSCDPLPSPRPVGTPPCGPSWRCAGQVPPLPSGTPEPGTRVGGQPATCTLTPPVDCAAAPSAAWMGDLIALIYGSLTGEYRATALSLLDLVPLAEICVLSGNPGVVAGCVGLEVAIGAWAFAETEKAIGSSTCSERRKTIARATNASSFLADLRQPWGEAFEVIAFAAGSSATSGC